MRTGTAHRPVLATAIHEPLGDVLTGVNEQRRSKPNDPSSIMHPMVKDRIKEVEALPPPQGTAGNYGGRPAMPSRGVPVASWW